jgi:uncharacterized protein YbaR (Trm112 family)
MAIDPFLLEILVCPETRANVSPASPELLQALQAAAEKGTLVNRGGLRVDKLDGALVRQDEEVAYPVRDDIPLMRLDDQLNLRQLR